MSGKKIGIITMLYKTRNYGGCLQAYALTCFLNTIGYNAEQILLDSSSGEHDELNFINRGTLRLKIFIRKSFNSIHDFSIRKQLKQRDKLFDKFIDSHIKNSCTVYTLDNITNACDVYNTFIVGSDQLWHPSAVHSAFLLEFVPRTLTKLSYSVSMPVNSISAQYTGRLHQSLQSFKAISVRESETIPMLTAATGRNDIICCIDPVFLLSMQEWDKVAASRIIEEKYILCYFLGNDTGQRKIAEEFASSKNMPIVTLPNLNGHRRKCDECFGTYRLYNVSPSNFISLIKYSEYVITDSFHAMAFSIVYHKEFFVFTRSGYAAMSSRICNLCTLCDCEEHFCSSSERRNAAYISSLPPIDYSHQFDGLATLKEHSISFLASILGSEE